MDVVLIVVGIAVALALAVAVGVWLGRLPRRPRPGAWETAAPAGGVVTLDLAPTDPEHPSVRRLVEEAGRRALLAQPELDEVQVRDRDGRELGRVGHPPPLPPEVALPPAFHEPHTRRSRTPDPVRPPAPRRPVPPSADPEAVDVPLADAFDLDPRVRAELRDRDHAVELVRAVLTAAGHPPEIAGDLLRVGDVALAVVPDVGHGEEQALTRAFLRIQGSGASRGIVVHLGWLAPDAVRHREAAAPHVRHVGPEGIQRMADAVVAGADPIDFVLGPAVLR